MKEYRLSVMADLIYLTKDVKNMILQQNFNGYAYAKHVKVFQVPIKTYTILFSRCLFILKWVLPYHANVLYRIEV